MVGGLCRDPCKPRAISNVAALLTAVLSQSARNNNMIKRRVLKSVMENILISYCSLRVNTCLRMQAQLQKDLSEIRTCLKSLLACER